MAELLGTVWNEMAVNWLVSEKGLHVSGHSAVNYFLDGFSALIGPLPKRYVES